MHSYGYCELFGLQKLSIWKFHYYPEKADISISQKNIQMDKQQYR